ncbi:MAG: NADH-quinone oxidoreductase subunit C [Candidatus Thiodiazotropha sp.]
MNGRFRKLKAAVDSARLEGYCDSALKDNPSGLPSAWLVLEQKDDIHSLLHSMRSIGARMATMTVYRPDAAKFPDMHEIAYHMVLEGMPVTVTVRLEKDDFLPSATRIFPNLDWDERELMELTGVEVRGHPNPRRLFLDKSIESGVFDRLVPYSEMTNVTSGDAVWQRVREQSDAAEIRRRQNPDSHVRRNK